MKSLHRPDLFCWSAFDESRNVDFNSVLWVREGGNVVVDPMPMSEHDQRHLDALGGARFIVITNSDHTRDAVALAARTGAKVVGPAAERDGFPIPCQLWLEDGDELVAGLLAIEMHGSKTPGELCLALEGSTLITGDLVRAHRAGALMMLPKAKITDWSLAAGSVRRLAALPGIEAVLVGDGWPVFRDGGALLAELVAEIDASRG